MNENVVQVDIIDDSSRVDCEVDCGIDWSSPEALDLATQRIKDRFAQKTKLTYLDLSENPADKDILKWSKEIEENNLALPLLLVNGQLRISGLFDIRQLLDTIEIEIEIGAQH